VLPRGTTVWAFQAFDPMLEGKEGDYQWCNACMWLVLRAFGACPPTAILCHVLPGDYVRPMRSHHCIVCKRYGCAPAPLGRRDPGPSCFARLRLLTGACSRWTTIARGCVPRLWHPILGRACSSWPRCAGQHVCGLAQPAALSALPAVPVAGCAPSRWCVRPARVPGSAGGCACAGCCLFTACEPHPLALFGLVPVPPVRAWLAVRALCASSHAVPGWVQAPAGPRSARTAPSQGQLGPGPTPSVPPALSPSPP
jgi:hypothetical protein